MFHSLRDGKINTERDNQIDSRILRATFGHEKCGTLTPAQMRQISESPVPEGNDWDLLATIDFEAFARVEPRRKRPKKPKV